MKILIDLSSIRPNPDYGNFRKFIKGSTVTKFTCKGAIPIILSLKNIVITKIDIEKGYTGYVIDGFSESEIKDLSMDPNGKNVHLEVACEPIEVPTLDESKYLFNYVPTLITCDFCGVSFDHSNLVSDSCSNEEDLYSEMVCPKCGAWGCVEFLEYETIEEALIRKNESNN